MDRRAKTLAAGSVRPRAIRVRLRGRAAREIVDFKFRPGPPTATTTTRAATTSGAYAAYYHAMRARGVLLPPSQNEVMFVSTAHGDDDVALTCEAIDASLRALRAEGVV